MFSCPPPSYLETLLIDLGKFAIDIQKHQNLLQISRQNFQIKFGMLNSYAPEVYQELNALYREPEAEVIDIEFEYL